MSAIIDDTYAEAFKSIYVEILITAVNQKWVKHAVDAATGNASSSILCDCEAGFDRFVGPGGALVIGISAGFVCYNATVFLKQKLKIDDSLDVFPGHGVWGPGGHAARGCLRQ